MLRCKGSSPLEHDNANLPGDEEALNDVARAKSRSAALTLLYLSNERPGINSMVRLLCWRVKSPDQRDARLLKNLLRYSQDTKYAATQFKPSGVDPVG